MLGFRDIRDLCAALVVDRPRGYKAPFTFSHSSHAVVRVLFRHGVIVLCDDDTGRPSLRLVDAAYPAPRPPLPPPCPMGAHVCELKAGHAHGCYITPDYLHGA